MTAELGDHPMLELTEVSKTYRVGGQTVRALDGITLTLTGGEFVSVVGPSGSGKSTLLHLLGALDRPDSGSIRFQGKEIGDLNDDDQSEFRRCSVGFVFQFFNLLPTMTAWENVAVPKLLDGARMSKVKSRALDLLALVDLADRAEHRPSELSGGQMQRVAVARALMMDPPLILADEPTGNLDTKTGTAIMELLNDIAHQHGRSVVMVTHNLGRRIVDGSGDHLDGRSRRLGCTGRWAKPVIVDRMRAINLRELRRHPARTSMLLVVVAISATLLVAVLGIAGSITGSSNRLVAGIGGNASLEVSGVTDTGFPEALLPDIAKVPGVAAAVPMLRTSVGKPSERVVLLGVDEKVRAMLSDSAARGPRQDRPLGQAARSGRGRVRYGAQRERLVPLGQRDGHRRGRHRRCRCRPGQRRQFHCGAAAVDTTSDGSGRHDRFGVGDHRARRRPRPGTRRASPTRWADEPSSPNRHSGPRNPVGPWRSCAPSCCRDGVDGTRGRRVPDLQRDEHGDHATASGDLDASRHRRQEAADRA